jgi:hypothetical protein
MADFFIIDEPVIVMPSFVLKFRINQTFSEAGPTGYLVD